jgi:hypothetical protein
MLFRFEEISMKFKYKRAILLTMMSTIGMGLLIISLSNNKSNAEENNSNSAGQSAMSVKAGANKHNDSQDSSDNAVTTEVVTAVPTAAPTPSPIPTPLPVYHIEENGNPKITELITNYYTAMNNCDADALQNLASDPSAVYTPEALEQITEYCDGYLNIKAYVKKGYIDGTYIVYAYYENKIINIKTPAPSLSKFYVITDPNGDLKIFFGTIMDEENKAYYDARNTDEDVMDLITMTNEKYDEAKASDNDLKNFCDSLGQLADGADTVKETGGIY